METLLGFIISLVILSLEILFIVMIVKTCNRIKEMHDSYLSTQKRIYELKHDVAEVRKDIKELNKAVIDNRLIEIEKKLNNLEN